MRQGSNRLRRCLLIWAAVVSCVFSAPAYSLEPFCPGGSQPSSNVIFCDDFDGAPPALRQSGGKYFEIDTGPTGQFVPQSGIGVDGSKAMRATWTTGQVSAGGLHVLFGRVPNDGYRVSTIRPSEDFREIYWRLYLKMEPGGWNGGDPAKLTRAFIFADPSHWGQAMIAHLWSGPALVLDPAEGVRLNTSTGHYDVVATSYNDFAHLDWLGAAPGSTQIYSAENTGKWFCVEAHVKLNSPPQSDGVFEYWINDSLEARRQNLNWVGDWQVYGINAVYFENYTNGGSPAPRSRTFDNLVIGTQRIGCLSQADTRAPAAPSGFQFSLQ